MTENETNSTDNSSTTDSSSQPQANQTQGPSAFIKLSNLFKSNTLDAAAWCIRLYIVILSGMYILLGGAIPSVDGNYKKALIANALVACIRLQNVEK